MNKPSLRTLAWSVARDVIRTVGGGTAAMELLRRDYGARGWLDASGHALIVAVARLTPGTNILAYCVALGWRTHRLRGSLVALGAASIPSALLIAALSAALVRVDQYRGIRLLLAVGALIASALVFSSAWYLVLPYWRAASRLRVAALIGVSWALLLAGMTPVRILVVAAALGLVLMRPSASA